MSDNHESQKNKKLEFRSYSEKSVQQALTKIRSNEMSVRKASITYNIPRSTLGDILHDRVPEHSRKMGPDTVLTEAEEKRLVKWCITLAKCGFPRRNEDLLQTVHKIVTDDGRKTPFENGRLGKKWLFSFFKRHPELSLRTPEGISKGCAIITEQTLRKWFSELESFLVDNHYEDILLDPTRIFNGDEAGFSMCPKVGRVIGPKGWKNIYNTQMGNEKENITVLLVFSASGETLPPVVVYPYVRPPRDVVNSMPPSWILGRSETGWMNSDVFYEYVANSFNQWIEEKGILKPVVLFIDGHKSHMTMHLSETCDRHGIILYAFPPNATHIMQAADVSVFRPDKANWKDTIEEWQSRPENVNTVLTKTTFAPLLERTLTAPSLPETIRNGFRTCGLYPFNPDAVDYSKCVQNTTELLDKSQTSTSDDQLDLQDIQSAEKVIRSIAPSLEASGMDVSIILEAISKAMSSIPSPAECSSSSTSHISTETSVVEVDLPILETASPDILIDTEDILNSDMMFHLPNHVAPLTEISEPISLPMNTVSESILVSESEVESIYLSKQDEVRRTQTLPSAQHDSVFDLPPSSHVEISDIPLPSPSTIEDHGPLELTPPTVTTSTNTSMKSKMTDGKEEVSNVFDKHLFTPKPIAKSTRRQPKERVPSAISPAAWRQHMIKKEEDEKSIEENRKRKKEQREREKLKKIEQKNEKGEEGKNSVPKTKKREIGENGLQELNKLGKNKIKPQGNEISAAQARVGKRKAVDEEEKSNQLVESTNTRPKRKIVRRN